MSDPKFEWKGKTYVLVPAGDPLHACKGCAFSHEPEACGDATDAFDCSMPDREWIELVLAGPAPEQVCRSPYCECDVGKCRNGLKDMRGTMPDAPDSKPTNPKDAIGIRKAPLSTLPMGVVAEMGAAMLEGAAKYGRHNYRGAGVRASVYFDATMRHLISWWEGEDIDPDSGLSHVTKALVSLAVLRDAMMQNKCEDDRPPRSAPFYPELNDRCSAVLDRHADKSPKHWTIKDSA